MAPIPLTQDMIIVFAFLIFVALLFIFDLVRVDMAGLLMMALLPLSGVISPAEAISGLSSSAVVSIIATIIIGEGLEKTGVMNHLARLILRVAGKSEARIMILVSASAAFISSFMQNIGAAALFLPVTSRICRQVNVSVSRILIPMGYCVVLGGCVTLVGSSPLILLNDLMAAFWSNNEILFKENPFEPFGLFSVTPIGIALVASAIIYFMVFRKLVLPAVTVKDKDLFLLGHELECTYGREIHQAYELTVPEDFLTKRLDELFIRPKYHSTVICICKKGQKKKKTTIQVPSRSDIIEPGDVIGIISNTDHIHRLTQDLGWELHDELNHMGEILSPDNAGVMEAVVTPRSELVGKTLHKVYFRKRYQVNPIALYRKNKAMFEDISEIRIQPGDALLMFGEWEKFHLVRQKKDLAFTEHIKNEVLHPEKAGFAAGSFALALVLALGFKVQLPIALLTGAIAMIRTRVLTLDEAYRGVDWMTVFLLAGLIPFGLAFEKTGAALYLATSLAHLMQSFLTPLVLFLLIGLLTSFFTLVTSNVGATVLMIPLAMNLALQCGADPRMAALLVALAASNTFILPTNQVNALIMRPGGYKVMDYVRAGSGITLLFIIVVITIMYFFYDISA